MTATGSGVSSASRIHKLEATFELVTPAFVAGACPQRAELRLPSILGPLRFWWRALAWSRTTGSDDEACLKQMRNWESALFGGPAAYDTNGRPTVGQGSFIGRLVVDEGTVIRASHSMRHTPGGYTLDELENAEAWDRGSGINYLAGQGLSRQCILPGMKFTVHLRSRVPFRDDLIEAVRVFGLIGGIGSRSRRGFGSVKLKTLVGTNAGNAAEQVSEQWKVPSKTSEYRTYLSSLLPKPDPAYDAFNTPFTSLTPASRIVLISDTTSAPQIHDRMGHYLHYFRSYGYGSGGRRFAGGVEVTNPNFKPDHDWFCKVVSSISQTVPPLSLKDTGPQRAIFGLPHGYFTRGKNCNPDYTVKLSEPTTDRRASPLFLHIHSFDNKQQAAVWIFLPGQFSAAHSGTHIPALVTRIQTDKICKDGKPVKDRKGKTLTKRVPHEPPWEVQVPISYEPIEHFLSRDRGPLPNDAVYLGPNR